LFHTIVENAKILAAQSFDEIAVPASHRDSDIDPVDADTYGIGREGSLRGLLRHERCWIIQNEEQTQQVEQRARRVRRRMDRDTTERRM
jgi:hypothetical protein